MYNIIKGTIIKESKRSNLITQYYLYIDFCVFKLNSLIYIVLYKYSII